MTRPADFDLSKIDYKAMRRAKRHKLVLWSAPVVFLVLLVALWFVLPIPLTAQAIKEYKQGNYQAARAWLVPLTITSPEPFVIVFNTGTIDTKLKKFDRAERELTRAVAIAPKPLKCMAAQNLAASLKAHEDSSGIEKLAFFQTKVSKVVSENSKCFPVDKASASGGGGGSSSNTSTSPSVSDAQQQQLQQKEQEGRERQKQYARDEQYDPTKPQIKPW